MSLRRRAVPRGGSSDEEISEGSPGNDISVILDAAEEVASDCGASGCEESLGDKGRGETPLPSQVCFPVSTVNEEFRRERRDLSLYILVVCFTVYFFTLNPSVPGGDSGELIYTAYNFGAAHPPGYPLFTIIGYLFIHLVPFGSVAWRVNLSCTVCGSLAAMFLYLAVAVHSRDNWCGVLSAGLFAFCPLVWKYTVEAEVFPLNNLLCSLLLFLTVSYVQDPCQHRFAYLGALTVGLAACNQHTSIFFIVPFVLWVAWAGRCEILRPLPFFGLVLCGIAGLSPYFQLHIGAMNAPIDSWGDQRRLEGFLHHFLRRDYGTFKLAGRDGDDGLYMERLRLYSENLWLESLYGIGFVFGLLGAVSGFFVDGTCRVLAVTLGVYLGVFNYLANLELNPLKLFIQMRFWQQPNILVYFFAGYFLSFGRKSILCLFGRSNSVKWKSASRTVVMVLATTVLLIQLTQNFSRCDEHKNFYTLEYGKMILDPIPKGALLLINGDLISNSVRYLQYCENYRTDITLLNMAMLTKAWYVEMQQQNYARLQFPTLKYHPYEEGGFSIADLLDRHYERMPIFLAGDFQPGEVSWQVNYVKWPFGMGHKLILRDRVPKIEKLLKLSKKALPKITSVPPTLKYPEGSWEFAAKSDAMESHHRLPYELLMAAINHNNDPKLLEHAIEGFETVIKMFQDSPNHDLTPHYYKNIGIAYARVASVDPRTQFRVLEPWTKYLEMAPDDDKDVDQIREHLVVVREGYERYLEHEKRLKEGQ